MTQTLTVCIGCDFHKYSCLWCIIDSVLRPYEMRRCSILGPTQSRISPSVLSYTKVDTASVLIVIQPLHLTPRNPASSTPDPKILNPQPSTSNPQHSTLNPELSRGYRDALNRHIALLSRGGGGGFGPSGGGRGRVWREGDRPRPR